MSSFIATKLTPRSAEIALLFLVSLSSVGLHAQTSNREPDVVVFPNGEKLIGHFESFVGGTAKFKSDTLGEITIDLSKVQELHTSEKFAVIGKNVNLARGERDGQIPVGTISVADKTVQVNPGNGRPTQTVPVADLNNIIDEASFDQAFHHSSFFQKWNGAIAVGTSIVEATQNSVSLSTTVSLVRAVPSETWLAPRNRTLVDFSDSYGKVTQPGTPEVKTSIYHADAERDEYFTPRVYALGSLAFDHNFSQGLDLQQIYGGGIGWSAIHKTNEALDFKGSIDYEKQQFEVSSQNQNLLDSIFAELYTVKFAHGIAVNQQISASPAWTNTRAYSAYASVGITLPVYKRFGFTANAIDSFLNDPPIGFKKNSVQFTTGLSYTLH
ncbi:MAG TPA: DUF481 domain-containing protein [Candidatus Acidoferrales bacterium]|nr:DUF481 domain-containing protein [Candidatus Acidoferrales bacterium]